MSDSFIIFNQLAANRRLGRVESELRQLGNESARQASQKAVLDRKRSMIFSVKRELDKLQSAIALSDFDRALSVEMLIRYLEINQVTEASFTELIDKEYASRTIGALQSMRAESRNRFGSETMSEVMLESERRYTEQHLKRLSVLLRIKETLPATPIYRRVSKRGPAFWIVLSLILQPLLALPYLIWPEFDMATVHFISNGLFAVTAWIALRETWFSWIRWARKSKLTAMADEVGLSLGGSATKEGLTDEINAEFEILKFHGFRECPRTHGAAEKALAKVREKKFETTESLATIDQSH